MILTAIRMKVLPEKRKELSQAVTSLVASIRKEKGCTRCELCASVEDENELCLFGEWESTEDLKRHIQSNLFDVLRGAMSLLRKPHEMKIYTCMPDQEPRGLVMGETI